MSDFLPMELINGGGFARPAGGDSKLWVKFRRVSRVNPARSNTEGRPIHEATDFVKIQQPGERDCVDRPVLESDKARFPRQWAAYQQQIEQTTDGTPVTYLFPAQPQVVDLLAELHIDTVEQLSGLSEEGIARLGMEGRRYVEKAKSAMDKSVQVREVNRLGTLLDEAMQQIAILKQANEQLGHRIDTLRLEPKDASPPNDVPRETAPMMPTRRQRAEIMTG